MILARQQRPGSGRAAAIAAPARVAVRDVDVHVVRQPGVVVGAAQVAEEQCSEARDVAGHGLRQQIDLQVGDSVEVRLASAVGIDRRKCVRVGCTRDRTRQRLSAQSLFELTQRCRMLLELILLARRSARCE